MPRSAPSAAIRPASNPRQGFVLLAALLVLVPAAKAILYDTLDPDAFIHLTAAEQMARDGIGPIAVEQSYMAGPELWTPYSWLAEFAMKFVWDLGGYRAAILTHALMSASLVALIALACATRLGGFGKTSDDAEPKSGRVNVLIATAFAAFLSIPYLSFRPVTATLVLMALCLWLIVRDRAGAGGERTRAVWLVIPLTVVQINFHLYAILMPAWFLALWVGALWEMRTAAGDARLEARRRVVRYTGLMVGTALACLATPMLPGVVRSIVFYQFRDPMVAGPMVREYQPFYKGVMGGIAATVAVIMLACIVIRRRKLRAGEVLWLLGSVVLLLRMGRFSPVFGMVAAPIFAAALPPLADRVLGRKVVRVAIMLVLGFGVYRLATEFPGPGVSLNAWLEGKDPTMPGYPAAAALFVEQNIPPRSGRLINEYDWGGYLGWRLGPKFKVLLDGRTNVYPSEFWRRTYFGTYEELAALLDSVNADAALVPKDGRFRDALESRGWETTFNNGGRAVVLVPPTTKPAVK